MNAEGGIGNRDSLVNISFAWAASEFSLWAHTHQSEFLIQILAMPLPDQAGKAVRGPATGVSPSQWMLVTIRKWRGGEEPSSEFSRPLTHTTVLSSLSHRIWKSLHWEGEFTITYKTRSLCSKPCQCPSHVSAAARISLAQSNPSPHLGLLLGFPR